METSTSTRGLARLIASLCAAASVAGCFETVPRIGIQTKSETEIAVEQIKGEWLKPCPTLDTAQPGNTTGDLLLDYVAVAGVAAPCIATHNSLIEYLAPVVAKEKARVLTPVQK